MPPDPLRAQENNLTWLWGAYVINSGLNYVQYRPFDKARVYNSFKKILTHFFLRTYRPAPDDVTISHQKCCLPKVGKKVLTLFRGVLVCLSSALLFYKTRGPQSVGSMEQTQGKHAHLTHSRIYWRYFILLHTAVGCSLLPFPYDSFYFSAFV